MTDTKENPKAEPAAPTIPLAYDRSAFAGVGPPTEVINHPPHYGGDTTYEAIKVIEAWDLGFNLGNVVKYISRADSKGTPIDDLRKAAWYLERELEKRRQS
jgi:hypothetical protein